MQFLPAVVLREIGRSLCDNHGIFLEGPFHQQSFFSIDFVLAGEMLFKRALTSYVQWGYVGQL